MILNICNILSEAIVILILIFLAILTSNFSKKFYHKIDNSLVILANLELAFQAFSSTYIFIRTIYIFIKKKLKEKYIIHPETQLTSQIEITENEIPQRCNSPV